MCGIPPRRGKTVRPLLNTGRASVETYLHTHGVPFREDESNRDLIYARNRIRLQVLPVLRELNPRLSESVATAAELFRADDAYLEEQAKKIAEAAESTEEGLAFPAGTLSVLPPALAGRTVRLLLGDLEVGMKDFTAVHAESILSLARGENPSAALSLPHGITVRRSYEQVLFTRESKKERTFPETKLSLTGETTIPGVSWTVFCRKTRKDKENLQFRNTFFLKCDMMSGELTVRPRRTGDRILLPGRGGSRSLKRLMIDCKIPRHLRAGIPVLADENGVLAVWGFGMAEVYSAQPGEECIQIEIRGDQHVGG